MRKVVVLLSGTGTNFQAILDATNDGCQSYEVVLVISNRRRAGGLEKAAAAGVPWVYVDPRSCASREEYDRLLAREIDPIEPDLIVLAGFMRILSPFFVRRYAGQIVNIHPSLLPAFPGKDAQAQAIEAGVTTSGVTVHYVDEGVDTGPIIDQVSVAIDPDDTVDTLSAKLQKVEHTLYPRVIAEICEQMEHTRLQETTGGGGY